MFFHRNNTLLTVSMENLADRIPENLILIPTISENWIEIESQWPTFGLVTQLDSSMWVLFGTRARLIKW